MRAGEFNTDENSAAESLEPAKESGGPHVTEKRGLRSKLIIGLSSVLGVALIGAVANLGGPVLGAVANHVFNGTASVSSHVVAAAPSHPEVPGDMPEPNCLTCFSGGKTFPEQAGGGSAKPTFRDPRTFAGQGPSVPPGHKIEVVCRFFDPNAPISVKPGWWYLIDSSPWNRKYYTVANSYLNGDPPGGPYITNVDNGVPECSAKS